MVTSVSSFGRSGLADWVVQRVSAVILLAYVIFLVGFIVLNPDMQFRDWQALFHALWVKMFTLLALLSLCAHAWVGMWTIGTDYITARMVGPRATFLRALYQLGCLALLFVYFIWCIQILWSV